MRWSCNIEVSFWGFLKGRVVVGSFLYMKEFLWSLIFSLSQSKEQLKRSSLEVKINYRFGEEEEKQP
jgi:hypothetical protein